MGEDYEPKQGSKEEKYEHALEELEGRLENSAHPIANRSNLLAILKAEFGWWWVGFYFLHN